MKRLLCACRSCGRVTNPFRPTHRKIWKQKTTNTNTLTINALTGTTDKTAKFWTPGPLTESDEEALFASSQETIKSTPGCTSHSAPEIAAVNTAGTRNPPKTALRTNQSIQAAKGENQRKKIEKSLNQVRKRQYQGAVFILGKIAKDRHVNRQ